MALKLQRACPRFSRMVVSMMEVGSSCRSCPSSFAQLKGWSKRTSSACALRRGTWVSGAAGSAALAPADRCSMEFPLIPCARQTPLRISGESSDEDKFDPPGDRRARFSRRHCTVRVGAGIVA